MSDPLPQPELDLLDAFEDHLALERHLSGNTVAAYRRDLTQLATFLARNHTPLARAPYPLLRRFLAQQHALGYARATIARRVGAIRTFYRWAVASGHVRDDPSILLGRPKVVNRLPTVLRPADAASLAEAPVDPHESGPLEHAIVLRDRAALELLYGSGLRVGEVAGLSLDRVQVGSRRVLVLGKGSKERDVPISEYAADALDAYLREARPRMASEGSRHLFFNRRRKPFSERDIRS